MSTYRTAHDDAVNTIAMAFARERGARVRGSGVRERRRDEPTNYELSGARSALNALLASGAIILRDQLEQVGWRENDDGAGGQIIDADGKLTSFYRPSTRTPVFILRVGEHT